MRYGLGVDLGTSSVEAAVCPLAPASPDPATPGTATPGTATPGPTTPGTATPGAGRPELIGLGEDSVAMTAAVYVATDGALHTGSAAARRAASDPDRIGRELKRRLGDPVPLMLGGTPHEVPELLATVLRDVVRTVSTAMGAAPERLVLTCPPGWGSVRRGKLDLVPELAGVAGAVVVTEPEAVAAYFATHPAAVMEWTEGGVAAAYDLGGGTFDATVLRRQPGGVEILGTPEGVERLGGMDFDESVVAFVNGSLGGALHALDLRDPHTTLALARLRHDCIAAKEALTTEPETVLSALLPTGHFDVRLTREEFEGLVRAPVESTIGAMNGTLRSARIAPDQLAAVLLLGGSSRIPLVARMVREELGRPVVDTQRHVVALGAAALAGAAATSDGRQVRVAAPRPAAPVSNPEPNPTSPPGLPRPPGAHPPGRPYPPPGPPGRLPSVPPGRYPAPAWQRPPGPPRPGPPPQPRYQPPRYPPQTHQPQRYQAQLYQPQPGQPPPWPPPTGPGTPGPPNRPAGPTSDPAAEAAAARRRLLLVAIVVGAAVVAALLCYLVLTAMRASSAAEGAPSGPTSTAIHVASDRLL